jgi:hypothetical protein
MISPSFGVKGNTMKIVSAFPKQTLSTTLNYSVRLSIKRAATFAKQMCCPLQSHLIPFSEAVNHFDSIITNNTMNRTNKEKKK